MPNPWLHVPLQDYEGHMSAPQVDQLRALSQLFAHVLESERPASIAIAGIAGGNGLEHICSSITHRIVGIDINPDYLAAVQQRYASMPGLELLQADLSSDSLDIERVDLVYAALVLEHAGTGKALENLRSCVAADGKLAIVLQTASTAAPGVSQTAYPAMQTLASHFALVDKNHLQASLLNMGMELVREETRQLPAGKGLWLGIFQ